MLGFSLPKLLVLAAIVAAVWYGFRMLSQRGSGSGGQGVDSRDEASAPRASEDLEPCPRCGAYVPSGTTCKCAEGG